MAFPPVVTSALPGNRLAKMRQAVAAPLGMAVARFLNTIAGIELNPLTGGRVRQLHLKIKPFVHQQTSPGKRLNSTTVTPCFSAVVKQSR